MNLVILSPDREIFSGEVSSVMVPGAGGSFEMLNNHAAIVSSLSPGKVRIRQTNGTEIEYFVTGGFVEMLHNEISLLVSGVKEG